MQFGNLPLRTRVIWLNVGALLLTLGFVVVLDVTMDRVRVNGSLYQEIVRGKNVIADILPPPQYIIDTRLAVHELLEAAQQTDAAEFRAVSARLSTLRQEYETRHGYWRAALPPGALREALTVHAYTPAEGFFRVVDVSYIPRLVAGDLAGARQVLSGELLPLYAEHRRQIDLAVALAHYENQEREEDAATILAHARWLVLGGWLLVVGFSWFALQRWWVRPVVHGVDAVSGALSSIGQGRLRDGQPRAGTGNDEFGQILRAVEQTRAQLRTLVESLESQRSLAEDAARAKGEFLANMSHEIRTPMNGIIGLTHLLRRTRLTEQQRGYLDKVRQSSESLLGTVNDILDFSKIEARELDLEHADFLLQDVLDRVVSVVCQKAHEKQLELLVGVAPGLPSVLRGDALRISQVLINLCANAVKFTERGEVVLSVDERAPADAAAAPAADGTLMLGFTVRDTGIGMTAEQVAGLFQPFKQVDASMTRRYGGTGLGLAISKRLVELMGGGIGTRSEPGAGSSFSFWIPCTIGSSLPAPETATAVFGPLPVLVIDDNPSARAILHDLLQGLGLKATERSNVAEGMAELQRAAAGDPYALVLLDAQPPDMGCTEAVRRIRGVPAQAPRIVLLAARSEERLLRQAVSLRLDGKLVKPFSPATLFDALSMALGGPRRVAQPSDTVPESPPSLRGLRVLLVEDNEFNQIVAAEMLGSIAGMYVTLVSNGVEAVEMVQRQPFDLVLMDVQMPVMDGCQAAALIRQDPAFAALPIVAITAHAMAQDRERCLAAGMNAYITKPFDPPELFRVLDECLAARKVGAVGEPPPYAVTETEGAAVSFELALERCMGRVDLFDRIAGRYLSTRQGDPTGIRAALSRGDFEAASNIAHATVSTAGALGAEALSGCARSLQQAIDEADHGTVSELLERYTQLHQAVALALQNYVSRRDAGQAWPGTAA
jgi:signal transduction histidine kinase/DNA-binding response OmpR family regulator/HPt (histidine-containing phosphotransfer) domain-containing protein